MAVALRTSTTKITVLVFFNIPLVFCFFSFFRGCRRGTLTRNGLTVAHRKISVIKQHPEALSENYSEKFVEVVIIMPIAKRHGQIR